jgi:hypothetical protein
VKVCVEQQNGAGEGVNGVGGAHDGGQARVALQETLRKVDEDALALLSLAQEAEVTKELPQSHVQTQVTEVEELHIFLGHHVIVIGVPAQVPGDIGLLEAIQTIEPLKYKGALLTHK